MAQVALFAAVSAFSSSKILAAGALLAGAIIDRELLFPALFPTDAPKNPKPQDNDTTFAYDGAPANLAYGRRLRVAGCEIIWQGPLIHFEEEGVNFVKRSYAVGICRNEVERIVAIYADGGRLFSDDVGVDIVSDKIGFGTRSSLGPAFPGNLYAIYTTDNTIDLWQWAVNSSVVVSGAANPGNNGAFSVFGKGFIGVEAHKAVFTLKTLITEAPGATVTLNQDKRFDRRLESISTYNGDDIQTSDPIIDQFETDTYGFRGTAYVVLKNLQLASFGNRAPRFSALIEEKSDRTVPEVLTDIMLRANYSAGDFDISGVSATAFDGTSIFGFTEVESVILQIMQIYDIVQYEGSDGKIYFRDRTSSVEKALAEADLSVAPIDSPVEFQPAKIDDISDFNIPRRVNVSYFDPQITYQRASQPDSFNNSPTDRAIEVNTGFTLPATQAKLLAERIATRLQSERQTIEFHLGPKHIDISPSDLIAVPVEGELYEVRVVEKHLGKNMQIIFHGIIECASRTVVTPSSEIEFTEEIETRSQPIKFVVLDLPAVFDEDVLDPVLYYAGYTLEKSEGFRGMKVYESSDESNFKLKTFTVNDHVIGHCDTTLSGIANYHTFDELNNVDVTVHDGILQSVTETQILEDRVNMCLIGSEILYFQNATLIGTNQYRLSKLLRGVRNTEEYILNHAADEQFVLLNSSYDDDIAKIPVTFSDLGRERIYSIIGGGEEAVIVNIQIITPELKTIKPFSVTDVQATRDGSDNITVTWKRRSRAFGAEFKDGGLPLVDGVELYDMEILDGPGGNVLRTFENIESPTQAYTAAQQTDDGLTPGDPVDFKIYQVSPIYGRGKPEEIEL